MAGNDTAALVVALSAQVTQFEKDMDKAVGIADQKTRQIENHFSKINPSAAGIDNFFAKFASMAGVALAVGALKEMTAEVAKLADTSDRIGIGIEDFQRLRFAIVAAGGSLEEIDQALDRFSKNVSDAARHQGALAEWVKENNVQLKDNAGKLLPLNDLLLKFSDLLKNAANPQDRMNLAVTAFGRQAGPSMVSALSQGSIAIKGYMDAADEAGVVIDKAFVKRAKEIETASALMWLRMMTPVKEFSVLFVDTFSKGLTEGKNLLSNFGSDAQTLWTATVQFIKNNPLGTAADFGNTLNDVLRQRALATLKSGGGTPLITNTTGFPGPSNAPASGPPLIAPDKDEIALRKLLVAEDQHIKMLDAEREALGLTVGEATALTTQVKLETEAKAQNIAPTAERTAKILKEAEAVGVAAQALERAKVAREIMFARQTAFLTPEDVAIAQRLKGSYSDVATALGSAEAASLRLTASFGSVKNQQPAITKKRDQVLSDCQKEADREQHSCSKAA